MPSVALSGDDTLTITGVGPGNTTVSQVFADFADGNVAELTFPNDIANVKTGKNGNSIYALNSTGRQADLKVKVLRGSADDKFLNNILAQQQNAFESFVLLAGTLVKKIGDGQGHVQSDTYTLGGGVMTKVPEAKSNVEGDIDQSTVTYTIRFTNAPRALT